MLWKEVVTIISEEAKVHSNNSLNVLLPALLSNGM